MNYLAKQAARARADAPIRPRLPALFEPAPIAPAPDARPPEIPAPRIEETAPPAPRAIAAEQVLRRESQIVREVVERVVPPVEPVHENPERRLPADKDAGGPAGRMPALLEPPREIQPLPPSPSMERPRVESHEPPPPRTIVDERIVRAVERIESQRVVRPATEVQPRVTTPIEPPPPARPHAPVPVATRAAERAPVALQLVESEPAVRITIGRVDVRAIVAPETPSHPAPAQPRTTSISLEDYLKQREGRPR